MVNSRKGAPGSVIEEFLEFECGAYVRSQLLEAVRDLKVKREYFTFNTFNVLLDFESGLATVEDVLAADRQESMPLSDFVRELWRRSVP